LAINLLLLAVFTLVAFSAEQQAFTRIDQMLSDRVQRPTVSALLAKRLAEFSGDFRQRLFYFDVILFLIGAGASWFLSGKTLKPIEEMVLRQKEFAADASHALRTPLTVIIAELEAACRSRQKLPKTIKQSFKVLNQQAQKMRQLINNLLLWVRLESGLTAAPAVFHLNLPLKKAFESLKPLARRQKLTYRFQENASFWVKGDAEALQQAFSLLLDNAIKFTPAGSVTLVIDRGGQNTAKISLTDTGSGIPVKDQQKIFQRFYRSSISHNIPGSGLGLAIAQKIILEHRGKIKLNSIVNQGSTFTVYLPARS
jgi:two-component system OmpR family sensor kinase